MSDQQRLALLSRTPLRPGDSSDAKPLPYGLDHLHEHGYLLRWSDAPHSPGGPWPVLNRVLRRGERLDAGLRGTAEAWAGWNTARHADAVLTVFEDVGMTAARLRSLGVSPYAGRPLVLLTCWLAQDLPRMSGRDRAAVRRSVAGASGLLVYSGNQIDILHESLDLPHLPIEAVPFGVDTDFYTPGSGERSRDIVAVGRDRSRDYRTLLDAVRDTGWSVTLVCSEYNLEGLDIPDEVSVHLDVDHATYRDLIRRAGLVVTPTHAPAYPGGQSTLLEAMATGAPCVMTDSPAIRDYVDDGRDAVLVPAHDASTLRDAIDELLADADRRAAIGMAAHHRVTTEFSYRSSWRSIGSALRTMTAG